MNCLLNRLTMWNSKKGEAMDILVHPGFVIFVAVMVLLYLMWFIYGLGSDFGFEKDFLATDMALTIDALLAAQGNVVLYYLPQRADVSYGFMYAFEKNKVSVFEHRKNEKSAGVYFFTSHPGISISEKVLNFSLGSSLPLLSLIGKKLDLADAGDKENSAINLYKLRCPGQKFDYGVVTLDPAHGYSVDDKKGSVGLSHGSLKEYVITREIAGMAKVLDKFNVIGSLTRDADFALPVSERKIEDSVVSVNIGDDNVVKAFINYDSIRRDESLKLACELVNSVSSVLIENDISVEGTAVVPVIIENEQDEQLHILSGSKPSVVLEIGSIHVPSSFSEQNKRAIASALVRGINNAYG